MDEQLEVLRALLAPVTRFSDASWAAASDLFYFRHFAAGAHIVDAGAVVSEVHFLLSGIARCYFLAPSGKEFNKFFATPGRVLGSISSVVEGTPSPFSIQALEPCACLAMRYSDVNMLCERHREWESLARRILERLAIRKERREADFMLLSAADRYRGYLQEYADIADRIPHYHVASYLGITNVALSRIRKRLGLLPPRNSRKITHKTSSN